MSITTHMCMTECVNYEQHTDIVADLPTRPYLAVLVLKSAGSMDVSTYFSKYGQRVSRKYRNRDMNEGEFVASKVHR